MKDTIIILKEIFQNFSLLWRVGRFNKKAANADNFLGATWVYVEPLIYSATFFVMLGMGMYKGEINGQPYLIWLLAGVAPWYFIMRSYNGGTTSIKSQLSLLTRTKVPIGGAPILPIISNISMYVFMMAVFFFTDVVFYGERPNIYWLQIIYAFFATIVALYAHNVINSTLAVLIPDYSNMMSAAFRVVFFTSGVVFNVDASGIPFIFSQILKMFPFWYVLDMYRETFIYHEWFWEQKSMAVWFWLLMCSFIVIGSRLQMKFRDQFSDMI